MEKTDPLGYSVNRRHALKDVCRLLISAGLLPLAARVMAETGYPSRPVDYIAPSGPGSGVDQLARLTSPLLERTLGVSFPVLNVRGAVGATAMAKMLAGNNDGYTMCLYVASMNALVAANRSSWQLEDLSPIARLQKIPSFLFIKQDSPYKDFSDLEKAVRSKPNSFKAAILGKGSLDDVVLKYMAGKGFTTITVPFSSPGERYTSILGGHADILYEQGGDVSQFVSEGEMRPVLVFNETRLPEFPDVPTSRELGYEIFLPEFRGVIAKAGTPADIVEVLSGAFGKTFDTVEMKEFGKQQLMAEDSYLPSSEFQTFLANETKTLRQLFKDLNI